jgi:hypothetical protein
MMIATGRRLGTRSTKKARRALAAREQVMRVQKDIRTKKSLEPRAPDLKAWSAAALATERADLERSHIALRAPQDPLQLAMLAEPAPAAKKNGARPRGR